MVYLPKLELVYGVDIFLTVEFIDNYLKIPYSYKEICLIVIKLPLCNNEILSEKSSIQKEAVKSIGASFFSSRFLSQE